MKRIPWNLRESQIDLSESGVPKCFVLLPETVDEKVEAEQAFESQGVCDSLSFIKDGINGRLDSPSELVWESDGAVPLSITTNDDRRIPVWFWLVECDDGSGRRFAWWSTHRDRDSAMIWA